MKKQYLNNFVPTQGENLWSDAKEENTIYREYLPLSTLSKWVENLLVDRICYPIS